MKVKLARCVIQYDYSSIINYKSTKMKKFVLLSVFLFFGIASINSQDRDQDQDRDRDQDRLMMVDGDVLQIRDRDQIRLKDELVLNDGTIVKPNGTYKIPDQDQDRDRDRDRDQLRLRDGECLDMDGIKYRNEYQYRYKVQQENKGLSQAQVQERNQNRFHVINIEGEMYQVRNQFQNRIQEQYEFANGQSITPDGNIMKQDRLQLRLKNGECLDMDGNRFENTYRHRTKMIQKNMNKNKNKIQAPKKPAVQKSAVQKKKGKIGR